jgi:protein-disulfide isomerase
MTMPASGGTLTPPVGEGDHTEGRADAPVTLVEYGDYECPFCGMAFPIVQKLQEAMGEELRFVFRNFPLQEAHAHAFHAAVAAEVVGVHEPMFWRMHDILFTHQDALQDKDLIGYATSLVVPPPDIAKAFQGGHFADRVRADFRSGVRSGVNGTPTFFLNGERYDGDWRDPSSFLADLRAVAARA